MPNLLDTIKQNRDQLAGQQAPATDQTQKVQQLLRAKSGQAVTGGDATISNIGEQAANDQTNQQLQQQGQQIQLQQQSTKQAAQQEQQQTDTQKQQLDQAKRFQTIENRMKTNNLLNDLTRDKASLSLDKDRSRLEQAAFLLSMQDKQYTDNLQDIGRKRGLDNDMKFKDEMQQVAFGDNLDILQNKLGQDDVMRASDRQFKQAMSNMSIDDAQKIAAIEIAGNAQMGALNQASMVQEAQRQAALGNAAGKAQGLSGLLSAGISGAGKLGSSSGGGTNSDSSGGISTDTGSSSGVENIV